MARNLSEIIPAFFTGPGGARLTPEQIAQRRAASASLIGQATDTSPNAGGVASILTKALLGGMAGYDARTADNAIGANAEASSGNVARMLAELNGGYATAGQGATVASTVVGGGQNVAPAMAGPVVAEGEIADYIRQSAAARGIDPDIALRVAMSEGGVKDPVRQSDVVKNGVREASYGPFQLYMGGGLGNKALEAGIDPRDPNQWRQGIDFALDQAAAGGWGPWYGAAKVGIGNRAGLDNARAIGFSKQSTQPAAAAIETAAPSTGYVDPEVRAMPRNEVASALAQPTQVPAPTAATPAAQDMGIEAALGAGSFPAAPTSPAQRPISPAVIQGLGPYASPEERSVAGLLLNQHMSQQQAAQQQALAQQQRQQEIARRQQIAQQAGIDPSYALDDELWKGATGNIFAAPSTTTVGNSIIDNRTGQPIYQGAPERQPLMNLGDGTVYDPNAPQDQRFIQAPNGNRGFRQANAEEIKAYGTNGQVGPDGKFYPITPPQGTALSVDPTTGAVTFNQGAGVKPLTEGQSKDSFFTTRMTAANPTLEANETALLNLGEKAAGAAPLGMGNYLQSEQYQLARDAGRDFVTAYLRKDSGAALTPAEERLYGELLLPQPGDKPATIELKRQRRQVAVEAIKSGMPPQAVDGVLKAIKAVPGAESPTTPSETPTPSNGSGWREVSPGIRIRPKGGN